MWRGLRPLLCRSMPAAVFQHHCRTRAPNFVFPDADGGDDRPEDGSGTGAQRRPLSRPACIGEMVENRKIRRDVRYPFRPSGLDRSVPVGKEDRRGQSLKSIFFQKKDIITSGAVPPRPETMGDGHGWRSASRPSETCGSASWLAYWRRSGIARSWLALRLDVQVFFFSFSRE